jgi:MFS family permease
MTASDHSPGARSAPVLALLPTFIVVAVDATGMGIILPLLPFYSLRLGATPFIVGALISVYALCQLIAGPVVGTLSDRYGRKSVLIASQLGSLVGFVLLASAGSLMLVFLARIVDGLTSGNISVAHAYAAKHSAPSTRKQALGTTSGAIGTGLLVGPALSGFLVQFGVTAPIWAAAALSLISILATIVLLPPDDAAPGIQHIRRAPEPKAVRTLLLTPHAWGLLGLLILFFFASSMFMSQIALFLAARFNWRGHPFGARELGVIFAYAGLINMIVQGLLITQAGRFASDRVIVVVAFASMGMGFPWHRHHRHDRPSGPVPDADHPRQRVQPNHPDGGIVAKCPALAPGHDHGPQSVADVRRQHCGAAPQRRTFRPRFIQHMGSCHGRHRQLRRDHYRRPARATPPRDRNNGQASRPSRADLNSISRRAAPCATSTSHRPRSPIPSIYMKPLQIRRID